MNQLEITERLILAAEIGARGNHVGPAHLRAQQLPYVHTQAEMNGWGHRRGEHRSRDPRANACRLRPEDDEAHAAHRDKFFSTIPDDPRSVSEAEEAMGWYALVEDEDDRAALAGWVGCMADNKRRFFKDWCRRAGISEKTGRKRKNAAVSSILARLVRSVVVNCEKGSVEGLLDTPEIDDVDGRIGNAWRSDPYQINQSSGAVCIDWAEKRNEHRRKMYQATQREKKRKAA